MTIALLVSTYNWTDALIVIFEAIKKQTVPPDEILIADDGSREDTRLLIDKFRKEVTFPVKHIWHEDKGFRKSKILNKAVASTHADYIIQMDGDCIPEKHFIEDHALNAEKNCYLYGTRVGIPICHVAGVLQQHITGFSFFSTKIKKRGRSLRIPWLSRLYKRCPSYSKKFRGCNMSFWRNDFLAINGYNEDFEGWGREDSDLAIRLNNNQLYSKRLRYCGIVFHLDHTIKSKDHLEQNNKIQENTISKQVVCCRNGVDQYIQNRY